MNSPNPSSRFRATLMNMLRARADDPFYPCIQDLVANGLDWTRVPSDERPAKRTEVTLYLAAWSRHAGLSEEESRSWLVEFCATALAPISNSTPAAIRHSTKGCLRYIYRSSVPLICEGADNRFRAACHADCPVFAEMLAKRAARAEAAANPAVTLTPPEFAPVLPVKVVHRAQFEQALTLLREETRKGAHVKCILELLANRGLKTRTGRPWTPTILRSEMAKLDRPEG